MFTLSSYINSFKPDLFIIDTPLLRASSFLNSLSFASDLDVAAFIDSLIAFVIYLIILLHLVYHLSLSILYFHLLVLLSFSPDVNMLLFLQTIPPFSANSVSQYIPSSPRILLYFGTCPSHF